MAQFLRPDSTVTATSFTNGFAAIDEATASDADFAYGANNTAAVLEVGLGNPASTPTAGTTTVRYRVAKTNNGTVDAAGNAVTVTAQVFQGGSLIASDTARTATGTWTAYSFAPDMSGVTDWTDVRLRFTTSASGGSPANRRGGAVSWAELEAPDAAPISIEPLTGAVIFVGYAPGLTQATTNEIFPTKATLTFTGYAPSVTSAITTTLLPAGASVTLIGNTPWFTIDTVFSVGGASIFLSGSAPNIAQSANQVFDTSSASLAYGGYVPVITQTAAIIVSPAKAPLSYAGGTPAVVQGITSEILPGNASVLIVGSIPSFFQSANVSVAPPGGSLFFGGSAPAIAQSTSITLSPASASILYTGHMPFVSALDPNSVRVSSRLSLRLGMSL